MCELSEPACWTPIFMSCFGKDVEQSVQPWATAIGRTKMPSRIIELGQVRDTDARPECYCGWVRLVIWQIQFEVMRNANLDVNLLVTGHFHSCPEKTPSEICFLERFCSLLTAVCNVSCRIEGSTMNS